MSLVRSAGFVSASQLAKILIAALSLVTLSRLLPPADFGVYAMIVAVIGIGELFRDFGLSLAAIQAESISVAQRSALFWMNTAIGAALTLVAITASPLVATVYGRPALVPLVCAAAATFTVNGLAAQYRVDLTRSNRFRDLAIVDVSGLTASLALAIVLALLGAGPWALVLQAVGLAVVMLAVLVGMNRWLPGRPAPFAAVLSFASFGSKLLIVQVVSYVFQNLDKVLIGRLFGAVALGVYSKAFVLYSQPLTQALAPFTNLAVGSLSQLRDDRPAYLARLLKLQLVAGYAGLGGFALMIGCAGPLTALVLGPAWGGTVPLFRILCVGGLFQILGFVYYWMFLSSGSLRPYLACVLVTQPIAIGLVVLGALGGPAGVAWGVAGGLFVEWLAPATWGASRSIGAARRLLANTVKPLVAAAAVGAGSYAGVELLVGAPAVVQLLGAALGAVVVLALVVGAIAPIRADVRAVLEALAARRRARSAAPQFGV